MERTITLEEILLRLFLKGNNRFVQSNNFDVVYGDSEANADHIKKDKNRIGVYFLENGAAILDQVKSFTIERILLLIKPKNGNSILIA